MNVLVVDDEPLARQVLRRALDLLPDIACVGECGRRDEAVAMILERKPDIVLLDVQLGRTTAFEIIEGIGVDEVPLVIVVTGCGRRAVRALDVCGRGCGREPVGGVGRGGGGWGGACGLWWRR